MPESLVLQFLPSLCMLAYARRTGPNASKTPRPQDPNPHTPTSALRRRPRQRSAGRAHRSAQRGGAGGRRKRRQATEGQSHGKGDIKGPKFEAFFQDIGHWLTKIFFLGLGKYIRSVAHMCLSPIWCNQKDAALWCVAPAFLATRTFLVGCFACNMMKNQIP